MKTLSDEDFDLQRNKIIGLGESSTRKSYYPELQNQIKQLDKKNSELIKEIEERKKIQNELIESEKKYRNLFELSMDAVFLIDSNLNFLNCNPASLKLFGISSKEQFLALGLGDLSPTHQPDGQNSFEKAEKMITLTMEQNLHSFEWVHNRFGGQVFDASVLLSKVEIGGRALIQATVRDISEQKRTQEMLIQSEKMMSVGGLAAGMAHEINNPLAGMIQNANVLSNRLLGKAIPANKKAAEEAGITMDDVCRYIEIRGLPKIINAIMESGARMASIVENMLNFSRKNDSTITTHNPAELLDKVLELAATDFDLKKHYDFKNISIEKIYGQNLPLIPCEEGKIQQVLLNILKNGAHAMSEDVKTKEPKFILRLKHEKAFNMLKIEIEDNGPGIDKTACKRIFDPFFTTKPVGVGTGLGLSLSYFIITENHKGKITVISEPGKGANFIIRLPV